MEKQLLKDRENVNGQNVTGEKISQYLADCASKVTYQIKDVDTDNNTVTITCTYIDSSQIFANAFTRAYTEALSNALSQAFSGGGASIDFDIDSIFMEEANKVTEPVYVTKDVVLKFQEGEDGYELKENDNTDLYVVALSNLFGSFSEGVN
ncbi:MAG: hypothetical protein E7279_08995 [Lachnospiraceae bacterium]|nr:hypothetical protein [Lachnospiraceae bacterium]